MIEICDKVKQHPNFTDCIAGDLIYIQILYKRLTAAPITYTEMPNGNITVHCEPCFICLVTKVY